MSFQPYPTRSGFISLAVALISAVVVFVLLDMLFQQNNPDQIFKTLLLLLVVLVITCVAIHWTIVAFKLDYYLNRNGLAIQWGLGQQLVPFESITQIVPGQNLAGPASFRGINLAGLRFGRGEQPDYGPLKFRATAPLEKSLLIVTPAQSYVISPQQPDSFMRAWQARQTLGPTQHWAEGVRRRWPFNIPILTDLLAWQLLGVAALLLLALLGYISLNYNDIPGALPVHFDALGRADRIASRFVLFLLPAVGGIVWLVNATLGTLIYRHEKMAAYLLWSSTIVMQLCLWVALLTITG